MADYTPRYNPDGAHRHRELEHHIHSVRKDIQLICDNNNLNCSNVMSAHLSDRNKPKPIVTVDNSYVKPAVVTVDNVYPSANRRVHVNKHLVNNGYVL